MLTESFRLLYNEQSIGKSNQLRLENQKINKKNDVNQSDHRNYCSGDPVDAANVKPWPNLNAALCGRLK